ncbi:unnamed protein product, partial [Gongylonema pulchrum]|uniref:SFM domain-containing protein n=1 Tax=Gongylonema pulchrum TaxID=637853 RepID=A0A183EUX7_9BILA
MEILKAEIERKRKQLQEVENAPECEAQGGSQADELTHTEPELTLPRSEVIKRLRSRSQPITLFGETEQESQARLRRLEIEQPDMKEGWKNDFQTAMKEVDHELIEEVIKGGESSTGKHDVDMSGTTEDASWERIEANAKLLGEEECPSRDCDIIHEFF